MFGENFIKALFMLIILILLLLTSIVRFPVKETQFYGLDTVPIHKLETYQDSITKTNTSPIDSIDFKTIQDSLMLK